MTTLCEQIDTLAMVYLDDELDAAERRELELHLHDCVPCRDHIAAERQSKISLRAMLAAPPTPTLLRARISTALAAEDRAVAAAGRRGSLRRWALPGVAVAAAAAALAVFVLTGPEPAPVGGEVARAAVKVQSSSRPLAVQGASTGPGLAQPFEPDVVPAPRGFDESSVRVVGVGHVQIVNYEATQLFYEVVAGPTRFELSAFVLANVRPGDLRGTRRVVVDGHELWVTEVESSIGRTSVVSYEDQDRNGYVFMSQAFSTQALFDLVIGSDLVRRSRERVR